jgi:hypothetical protein
VKSQKAHSKLPESQDFGVSLLSTDQPSRPDQRNQKRVPVQLRADIQLLEERRRVDIMAGMGYPDLDQESLALSSPRRGRSACTTEDISASGMRLSAELLKGLDHGSCIEMDLHIPGERRVVKLLTEVMWADEGHGRAGLRFAALENEGLQRLRKYLEGLRD